MKTRPALVLLAALLLAATGCSKRHKVEVQSDTCWDGLINNDQHINYCGNATFKVIGDLQCVKVQKQTINGVLRVRIDGRPWAETTEPNGLVQVCD